MVRGRLEQRSRKDIPMSLLSCSRAFTITAATPVGNDMPLDQAVYHSPTDKIYGIRGGWVHVYNATTGALENSYWTLPCGGSNSSIVSCGSYLYAASWNAQIRNYSTTVIWQNTGLYMDVYRIDPTNLSASR